jgi:hypothetical protein
VDVDNTLLDNDRVRSDIQPHLERELGVEVRDRYWAIQEQLFTDLEGLSRRSPAARPTV